ncbi:MAG: MBL fold metallo-hydrolase [Pseudomonadales bacterium]
MQTSMDISPQPVKPVPLVNDGALSLYFVGTGSAFAKTLNQNNLLVVKGDRHLLVDCGTRCPQALHDDAGLSVAQLDNYLITHSHSDHIGGLEEVQLSNRYVQKRKPSMVITPEYEKILWEQSLRGGSELSEGQPLAFRDLWNLLSPRLLDGYPRETFEIDLGPINIKMPRTLHFPDSAASWQECAWSCAVILDERVLFTSDTRFDPDLIHSFDEMFNFECIFHDCQMFTGGVHASIHELATLPDAIRRKTILMHYGDNWQDFIPLADKAGFHSWAKQGHTYTFA